MMGREFESILFPEFETANSELLDTYRYVHDMIRTVPLDDGSTYGTRTYDNKNRSGIQTAFQI